MGQRFPALALGLLWCVLVFHVFAIFRTDAA